MIEINKIKSPFIYYCQKVIPLAFDESLSYYEVLCHLTTKIKEVIDEQNNEGQAIEELQEKYLLLVNYVDNYFDNLDIQEEINNKLDEMVEDGTMQEIIAQYLQLQTTYTYNNLNELKNAENLVNGMTVKTLGYHTFNDNGGAYYKIRNVLVSDEIDDMLIIGLNSNELVGELIIDNILCVNQLGAYGDGEHDDTIAIQKALDTEYNVKFVSNKIYVVSKNNNINYTNNEQPCLIIEQPKILYGNNAKLIVNEHGQGIIDINNTNNVTIENLILISNGEQVNLEGNSGLGEKGNDSYGYDTSSFFGVYRNNSYDTSNFTTHGNNGNPWGMFHNGFIGNAGNGITIMNNCKNITIKNCEIYGFNSAGIQISPYSDRTLNNPICKNITIQNNKIHDIYNAGILSDRCEFVNISNNEIYDIGHPDALITNTNQNPGYAISFDQSYNSIQSKNVNVNNNIIYNCVRKGVDLHGGEDITITNNKIKNCWFGGIFSDSLQTTGISKKLIISNNEITNCSYSTSRGDPIWLRSYHGDTITDEQFEKNTVVTSNLIENCGCERAFITLMYGYNIIITNNLIKGINSNIPSAQTIQGILTGTYLQNRKSKNIKISQNIISIPYKLDAGITTWYVENCIVNDNIIDCTNDTPTIHWSQNESKVHCYGNLNTQNENGNSGNGGFALTELYNNSNIGNDEIGILSDHLIFKKDNLYTIPTMINLSITANGTSSPTVTVRNGNDFINNVVSENNGVTINLQNINTSNASVFTQFTSSYPFHETNTSSYWPFIYLRAIGSSSITLGIKRGTGDGGQHLPIANADNGTLLVTILI